MSKFDSIDFVCLVQMSKRIVTGALLLVRPLKGGEGQALRRLTVPKGPILFNMQFQFSHHQFLVRCTLSHTLGDTELPAGGTSSD
jgi:hypothetical protein